jgi:hypothetical protein
MCKVENCARARAGGCSTATCSQKRVNAHVSLGVLAQRGDVGQVVDVEVSEGAQHLDCNYKSWGRVGERGRTNLAECS